MFSLLKGFWDTFWNCLQTCVKCWSFPLIVILHLILAWFKQWRFPITEDVQKNLSWLTLKCGFHSSNIPGLVIIAPSVWSSCFSWLSPAQPLRPESYVTSSRAAFPDYPDRRYGSALRVPQFGWHLLWSSLCHIFSNFSVWITGFHNRLWASWA